MWFFYSPIVVFGQDSLDFFEKIEGNRVFIVTDKMLVKLKVVDILTEKLKSFGKEWTIFDEVKPDPWEEDILKGAKACIEYAPNLIIGLGGGSSMDTAKSIWALYENCENPDFKIDDLHPFNKFKIGQKAKLVAIPTTSGTGAETTWAVVITRVKEDGSHIKLEQANKDLIPTYAIVDPIFTQGMPPKLTAATGFDAISHILEGMCSSWRNVFSDGMGIKGYELLRQYLPRAFKDGNDMEAREQVHNAATLAGLCFGNSQAGIAHSFGHVLGAVFGITHGNAVGLFTPYVMEYYINDPNSQIITKVLADFARMLGIAPSSSDDKKAATLLVEDVKSLQKAVNFPATLKDLGIKKEELEAKLEIIAQQSLESGSMTTSPRQPDSEGTKMFFRYAYEGKKIDF